MKKIQNYINGDFVPPNSGNYIENITPRTGKVYSLIPDSQEEQTITLSNGGYGDMNWSFGCADCGFIYFIPESGTTEPGGSSDVLIGVNTSGYDFGDYSDLKGFLLPLLL